MEKETNLMSSKETASVYIYLCKGNYSNELKGNSQCVLPTQSRVRENQQKNVWVNESQEGVWKAFGWCSFVQER